MHLFGRLQGLGWKVGVERLGDFFFEMELGSCEGLLPVSGCPGHAVLQEMRGTSTGFKQACGNWLGALLSSVVASAATKQKLAGAASPH